MIGMTYDEIKDIILEKSGVGKEEIDRRVEEKMNHLSGLISREGAAHIIANDLGVKIFDEFVRKIKINKLVPGMGDIGFSGRVVRVYDVREFKTERREGKVASFLIGDDSGVIRVVLWDINHIKMIEEGKLTEGKIIRIENAYVRENNGFPEVHLGNRGNIDFDVNEEVGEVNFNAPARFPVKISELNEGDNADITGTIVQIFEPKTYDSCSECRRRVIFENGEYICNVHGKVDKRDIKILNFYLDDGTGNIRVVAFGELAEELLKNENFEQINNEILGLQVRVSGRVKKNIMGARLEFNANSISEIDAKEASRELVKKVDV